MHLPLCFSSGFSAVFVKADQQIKRRHIENKQEISRKKKTRNKIKIFVLIRFRVFCSIKFTAIVKHNNS